MTPASAEHDKDICGMLARFRLPGEGPRRMVIVIRTSAGAFVFRGDGQTRQEADRKAVAKAAAFIRSHWDVT